MVKAICRRDLEALDGTRIKKGEVIDVTYGLFYPDYGTVSEIKVGRRRIQAVSIKDLEFIHY